MLAAVLLLALSSAPAFAGTALVGGSVITEGYTSTGSYIGTVGGQSSGGISVSTAVSTLNGTISAVTEMRAEGSLNSYMMRMMNEQLEALDKALANSGEPATAQVAAVITNAEEAVSGLAIAETVLQTISKIKAKYDLDNITVEDGPNKVAPREPASVGAAANPKLKGFSDVTPARWSYNSVMKMVEAGLFKGVTEPDENGMARFAPSQTMKRNEFLIVVIRYLYPNSLNAMPEGKSWYANAFDLALEKGILKINEFSYERLTGVISRQEMTMILIRAVEALGETIPEPAPLSAIADHNDIDPYYSTYVRQAFAMGLLTGYDEKGTFGPNNGLTREEAPTVIYRLLDPSTRAGGSNEDINAPETYEDPITIYEGEVRYNRPAREGDIFVKKDGTQIVLKKGEYGVLGAGQGVAPDLGLMNGNSTVAKNKKFAYDNEHYSFKDSLGNDIYNQLYQVNQITGEGHWEYEWDAIFYNYQYPEEDGTYEKQPSPDPYKLWYWRSNGYRWVVSY